MSLAWIRSCNKTCHPGDDVPVFFGGRCTALPFPAVRNCPVPMAEAVPVRATVQRIFNDSRYLEWFVPRTALFVDFAGGGGKPTVTLSNPYWCSGLFLSGFAPY